MPQAVSIPIPSISATRRGTLCFGGIAAIAGLLKPAIASPDAELIRLCRRLVAIHAIEEARPARDEDSLMSLVLDPLNVEWFEIQDRLHGIGGPRTPEGAIAAAFAALAEAPRDQEGIITCPDLATWLSVRCVEFIAGEVPA
jgi:hypothetical protein